MEIKKFKHVNNDGIIDDNRTTVYAVFGAVSADAAKYEVYKYKKMDYLSFELHYKCYPNCCLNTRNNKLYAEIASTKYEKPCYIIAKDTIKI